MLMAVTRYFIVASMAITIVESINLIIIQVFSVKLSTSYWIKIKQELQKSKQVLSLMILYCSG